MPSPSSRYLSSVGVLALALVSWTCSEATSPDPIPALNTTDPPTILVKDAFARSVTNGWGTADVGGPWRVDSDVLSSFRVDGARGLIVAPNHRPRNAIATSGYGLDVSGLVSFSIDRVPDNPGRFYTIQVYARRDDRFSDGDYYYRYRIRAFGTGKMDVRMEKSVDGDRDWVSDLKSIPTVWKPGQRYWIRWESLGASPTTLRIRVWPVGTTEPSTWQSSVAVTEPALNVAGTTGIRIEGPNADQVNFPITWAFDDLEYTGRN